MTLSNLLDSRHEQTLDSLRQVSLVLLGNWKGSYLYPDGRTDPHIILKINEAQLVLGQLWSSPTDLVGTR